MHKMSIRVLLLCMLAMRSLGAQAADGCTTSPASEGGTGSMIFPFRQNINMSSLTFLAYVRRAGDEANVLHCDRKRSETVTCDVINPAFSPTEIVNHSLTLTVPVVTRDLAGNYTLYTTVEGSYEPPVHCHLVVLNNTEADSTKASSGFIVTMVVAVLLPVAVVVISIVLVMKRKKLTSCRSLMPSPTTGELHELGEGPAPEQAPLLNIHKDIAGKLWYHPDLSDKEEEDMLKFKRNHIDGCYLITNCSRVSTDYYLKVYYGGTLKRFRLRSSKKGIDFLDEKICFKTFPLLIAHYQNKDVNHEDTASKEKGLRLAKPFEKAPGLWYIGKIDRKQQNLILQSGRHGPGAFFIRDGITNEDTYTLAMRSKDGVRDFRITVGDDGYKIVDAKDEKLFLSLSALVEYYQEHDLVIQPNKNEETTVENLGKLSEPAQGILRGATGDISEDFGTEIN